MKIDLTPIIQVLITLFCAVMTGFIIPLIKEKLTATKRERLKFWVNTAVNAAEQLYGSKTGQKKKEYVVSFLLSKGIVVDIDEVTALIESEVFHLTNETKTEETVTEK